MIEIDLWNAVCRERDGPSASGGGRNLETEIDRLHTSIDGLASAVKDLRAEIGVLRENARTDFSRLVDRQDSHFRWLVGLLVASTVSLAALLYKSRS